MTDTLNPDAPAPGPDRRSSEIARLRSNARKKIGARRGRPASEDLDAGAAPGAGGGAPADGGQPSKSGAAAPPGPGPVAAAPLNPLEMVDFLKSYHLVGGWMYPTHDHWSTIPDARVQAAAQTLVRVGDKMPAPMRVALGSWLPMGAVAMALYEVMGAPMLKSIKLRREEKAALVAQLEGGEGGPEKPA